MKKFGLLFAGAFALLTVISCSNETDIYPGKEEKQSEEAYATQATVTSSDANFTATDNGGTIQFKTEGGSVTLTVSCGCNWIAENTATDLFATSATSNSLTVTADQNTVENDLTGTITLMTETYRIAFATITVNQTAYGAPEITVETNEWAAPAKGVLTTEIVVEASADWTAESADEWLTVTKTDTGVSLTAAQNGETTERSTRVTLACTDGIRTAYEHINVNQDAKVYLTLSENSVNFDSKEDSVAVTVDSNFEWDYSYDATNSWLTFSRNGNVLTITASANDGDDDREATVIFTAGDGAANVAEEQLNISQQASTENDMVFTYTITSANTSTQLPIGGTVDCTVDWGDGTVESITTVQPSHTYAEAGEYDVSVNGTVTALTSNGISTSSKPLPIIAVKQWGKTGLTNLKNAFYYCKNLVSLPEITGDAFVDVTDVGYMFYYCSALELIPADLFEKCVNATSFQYTFYGCSVLAEIPEGLFDKCTKVTTFSRVFYNCSTIVTVPAGLFANCPNVTDYSYGFYGCKALTSLPSAGIFGSLANVTTFSNAFYNCSALESIPSGLFNNASSVTNFADLFYGCSTLTEIPSEGIFGGCSAATSFKECFRGCSALTALPPGLFDDCVAVTDMSYLCYGCSKLVTIPAGLFDNCTKVTTFSYCFYNSSLAEIPIGLFDYNTGVTDFQSTFYFCPIASIPEGLFDKCTKVTTFYHTFCGSSITEVPEGLFDNCTNVTTCYGTFQNCKSLTTVPTSIFSKNLKVTNFYSTFYSCSAIEGESPYTEKQVDGETKRVHLYERGSYTSELGCSSPTSYSQCFKGSTFSDMDSIPSNWGGNGN